MQSLFIIYGDLRGLCEYSTLVGNTMKSAGRHTHPQWPVDLDHAPILLVPRDRDVLQDAPHMTTEKSFPFRSWYVSGVPSRPENTLVQLRKSMIEGSVFDVQHDSPVAQGQRKGKTHIVHQDTQASQCHGTENDKNCDSCAGEFGGKHISYDDIEILRSRTQARISFAACEDPVGSCSRDSELWREGVLAPRSLGGSTQLRRYSVKLLEPSLHIEQPRAAGPERRVRTRLKPAQRDARSPQKL